MPTELTEARREQLKRWLRAELRGEVRFDQASRVLYATDASIYQIEPIGVVLPRDEADVRRLIEIAADQHLALLPRGAGTSLSGQAVGRAIVVDFSKYMNRILSFDPDRREVLVQPGVVLDQLNRFLSSYGFEFGPDVATASRATLGGMIGNNSAGMRSIVYGKTVDHVVELSVFFSDGTPAALGPMSPQEWAQLQQAGGREGEICRVADRIIRTHAQEIVDRYPRVLRRVSGYNLDELVRSQAIADGAAPEETYPYPLPPRMPLPEAHQPWNLARLVVGSEGTLALVTEARLRVWPRPAYRAVALVICPDLDLALELVPDILRTGPSAVECLDRMLLDLARHNIDAARYRALIPDEADTVLVVEYSGEPEEVRERLVALERQLSAPVIVMDSPQKTAAVWELRRKGVGLLYSMPGGRKPVGFVEDTAVNPDRLADFVRDFRKILARYGCQGSFYGHASVGCLHIRPLLDLRQPPDVARMKQIAREVVSLVLQYEGALSGEHGDGLARSQFNRLLFGDRLYEAFRQLKAAFDPAGLLNPGKIVDAPDMTDNLRSFASVNVDDRDAVFLHRHHRGFAASVDACAGVGACRKLTGLMCPSFMVTREEMHSTRGRANLLRAALSGVPLKGHELDQALDLCLMCKGCKAECPANVDLALLKAEYLHRIHRQQRRPLADYLVAHAGLVNRLASLAPRLVNRFQRSDWGRVLLEWTLGVDRRRPLPPLAKFTFHHWYRRNRSRLRRSQAGRTVFLLADCFTSYVEPQILAGLAELAAAAGYSVQVAPLTCCGRTLVSKGFLEQFRDLARFNVRRLRELSRQGAVVVGVEPSCTLTFYDEYLELPSAEREGWREDVKVVVPAEHFTRQILDDHPTALAPVRQRILVHAHCHQRAAGQAQAPAKMLERLPQAAVQLLPTGCCGMAGFFGYERRHYEVSVAIARRDLLARLDSSPDALLCASGFSCRSQVRDLTNRTVLHPVELIRRAADAWVSSQLDKPPRRTKP